MSYAAASSKAAFDAQAYVLETPHGVLGVAAKLAWVILWNAAGRRPSEVVISAAWLGHAGGRDDRAARHWLKALEAEGLIEVRTVQRGRLAVYLLDPQQVPLRRVAYDPQLELPFRSADQDEAPPCRPAGLAASPACRSPGEFADRTDGGNAAFSAPKVPAFLSAKTPEEETLSALVQLRRAQQGQRVAHDTGPPRANGVPAFLSAKTPEPAILDLNLNPQDKSKKILDLRSQEAAPLPTTDPDHGAAQRQREDQLVESLLRSMPELKRAIARKVIAGVLDGWLDWSDVQRAIDNGRDLVTAGRCAALWIYFVGAMRTKFREKGQTWRRGPAVQGGASA